MKFIYFVVVYSKGFVHIESFDNFQDALDNYYVYAVLDNFTCFNRIRVEPEIFNKWYGYDVHRQLNFVIDSLALNNYDTIKCYTDHYGTIEFDDDQDDELVFFTEDEVQK